MSSPGAKMTFYPGENSRSPDGRLLVDELLERFTGSLDSVVALRGIEGFGRRHPLQTSRQLTLSEDLPMALVAVDRTGRRCSPSRSGS